MSRTFQIRQPDPGARVCIAEAVGDSTSKPMSTDRRLTLWAENGQPRTVHMRNFLVSRNRAVLCLFVCHCRTGRNFLSPMYRSTDQKIDSQDAQPVSKRSCNKPLAAVTKRKQGADPGSGSQHVYETNVHLSMNEVTWFT